MTNLYADSSALVRAYLADERDHPELRSLILESGHVSPPASSRASSSPPRSDRPASLVDIATGVGSSPSSTRTAAGTESSRLSPWLADTRFRGPPLRTLDAIHLAVALDVAERSTEETIFVTRDRSQATAARKLGLTVR